jgi:hypothetical protein
MLDELTRDNSPAPAPLLSLVLPGGRATTDFKEQQERFIADSAPLQERLNSLLSGSGAAGATAVQALHGESSDWAQLVEQHFPAATNGRCGLTLYRLHAVNPAELFLDTFGRDEDDLQTGDTREQVDLVLGLLEEQEAG